MSGRPTRAEPRAPGTRATRPDRCARPAGPAPRQPATSRDDHRGGFVAGAETLLFGSLVFVVATLLVVNAWGVVDARMAADAIAREVARTLVEADPATATPGALAAVADEVAGATGRDRGVALGYRDAAGRTVSDPATLLVRCQRITVTATVSTTTIRLPFVGGWGAPWSLTGHHSEVVDPYRSGLAGRADCDA